LYYPEQAIFDIFLDGKDYTWLELDGRVYCDDPDSELKESLILHAWGPRKFWNGRSNRQWSDYYKLWLNIGGARFAPTRSKVKGIIRRFNYVLAVSLLRLSKAKKPRDSFY
jgi:hypothetical protein